MNYRHVTTDFGWSPNQLSNKSGKMFLRVWCRKIIGSSGWLCIENKLSSEVEV